MIVLVIIVCAKNGHNFIGIIIVILILVKIIQVFLFDGIRLFCEVLGP